MYKRISTALVFSLLASSTFADSQPANYADPASDAETTGFFGGMVVGGLAGGPPGVIIGAALGAMFGEGLEAREQVGDLRAELYEAQLLVAAAEDQMNTMRREYARTEAERQSRRDSQPQLLATNIVTPVAGACCDNTVLSLYFKTGSSEIESVFEEQLQSVVRIAEQMPTASIEITGYADRNGDANANLALSRQRSAAVKQFFSTHGIDNSSITTVAYGESQPVEPSQSFEADFFDRRVIVRLRDSRQNMLSQSSEAK